MTKVYLSELARKAGISPSSMSNVFRKLNIPQVGKNCNYNLDDDTIAIIMLEATKIKPHSYAGLSNTEMKMVETLKTHLPKKDRYGMSDVLKATGLSYGTVHAAFKSMKSIKHPGKGEVYSFTQEQYNSIIESLSKIKPRMSKKRLAAMKEAAKKADIAEKLLRSEVKTDHGTPLSKSAPVPVEAKPQEKMEERGTRVESKAPVETVTTAPPGNNFHDAMVTQKALDPQKEFEVCCRRVRFLMEKLDIRSLSIINEPGKKAEISYDFLELQTKTVEI
jgi:DNA-binding transcriptional regulator GbsR (MarR family)